MRTYPTSADSRIYPIAHSCRIYPVPYYDLYDFNPGYSSRPMLGEYFFPFRGFYCAEPPSASVTDVDYRPSAGGSWVEVSAGSAVNILRAVPFVAVTAVVFSAEAAYELRVTFDDGTTRTGIVGCPVDPEPTEQVYCTAGESLVPFANFAFCADSTYISSAEYAISGQSTVARTALTQLEISSGTHNTGETGYSLTDTTKDFLSGGVWIGHVVEVSTGATMLVSAITATTNPNDTLSGTLSEGTFLSNTTYVVRENVGLDILPARWLREFPSAGTYNVTLYLTDSSGGETSTQTSVEVA